MISTKGRYAIRVMIDLAEQDSSTPVTLDSIAQRQNISKKYLEAIVKNLVKAGLLKSTSGKGGGYTLLRKPEEYTVLEILEAAEISIVPVACLDPNSPKCPRLNCCKVVELWRGYYEVTQKYFSEFSIKDLCDSKSEFNLPLECMPGIFRNSK